MLALLVAALGLLRRPGPVPVTRHALRAAAPIASTVHEQSAPVTWLRNGTRLGYGIHRRLVVPSSVRAGTRLPAALIDIDAASFPTLSRARKACRRGAVLVNGVEGRCANTTGAGDVVELQARYAPGYAPRGSAPFAVDVLWEDDSLAVVLKPAGVNCHPPPPGSHAPGAAHGPSMRTAVKYAVTPPRVGTHTALYRPHLVHRLDKPTSGLLIVAKTKLALTALSRAFASRAVRKRYVAVCCGRVPAECGEIDSDIMCRRAITEWRVLQRCRSLRLGGGHLTLLELRPRTGRTHQLRRHCAEVLGAPIVGDAAYGGDDAGRGLFLSAVGLKFAHPGNGGDPGGIGGGDGGVLCRDAASGDGAEGSGRTMVDVEVDPPAKFESLLRREHERWELLSDSDTGAAHN